MNADDRIAVLNLIEEYVTARRQQHEPAYREFAVARGEKALSILREINYRLGGEKPE